MIQHPMSIYSGQNPAHKPWAYAFTGLVGYLAFFYKASRNLLSNPVSYESIQKRVDEILIDFPVIPQTHLIIERAATRFNTSYRPNNEGVMDAHLNYQDKFIPFLDLWLATEMVYKIVQASTKASDFYYQKQDGIYYRNFPKTKSGQWLKKYIMRRFPTQESVIQTTRKGEKYWLSLYNAMETTKEDLRHYLELLSRPDMTHARTIDFNKGTFYDLIDRLKRVTSEIAQKTMTKEKAALLEKQSPSEVFLNLQNGWRWVKIKDSYNRKRDEIEAKLMGHCATPEWDNSYLISLRDKKHEPWITATIKPINEMIVLGQVKGRGDDKPSKKHYNQLLALFLVPEIIMQKPFDRNDWRLNDFEPQDKELIMARKPYFNNTKKLSEHFPIKPLVEVVAEHIRSEYVDFYYDSGEIRIHIGTIKEFIQKHFGRYSHIRQKYEYEWPANYLLEDYINIDYSTPNYEAADWFKDELIGTKNGDLIYKAILKEIENEDQEVENPSDYLENLKWSFHYGGDLGQELYNAIDGSLRSSYESSLMNQLYREFQHFLEKINEKLPDRFTLTFYKNGKEIPIDKVYPYDDKLRVYLETNVFDVISYYGLDFSESNLLDDIERELNSEMGELTRYLKKIELNDYSSEYALDNFKEQYLPDLLIKTKEILKK